MVYRAFCELQGHVENVRSIRTWDCGLQGHVGNPGISQDTPGLLGYGTVDCRYIHVRL